MSEDDDALGAFARFFELSPDLLTVADFAGGLRAWNPGLRTSLGYADEELSAIEYMDLLHVDDRAAVEEQLAKIVNGGGSADVEARVRRRDGHYIWTQFHVVADIERQVFYGMGRDTTASREIAQQLRAAQRMEAVGQLAGGIAHDFNNLLQSIVANADICLGDMSSDAPLYHNVSEVLEAANRASQLTRQLLALGRKQPMELKPVSVNAIVSDVLRLLRRVIPESIEIDFIQGHDVALVSADAHQVEQVLMNLCLNARDAMPKGGRLTLETESVLINGAYRESHPWANPGRYVLLSISDDGDGMSNETTARVFEPFFTTKGDGEGTGLGLSQCYGIVKQHKGLIHVYSELGEGTTFKLYLPVTERRASQVGPKIEGRVPRGNETVLLAEDDELVRSIASRILTRGGYEVVAAEDGREALKLFEAEPTRYHLAVLDVVMPRLGGPAAARVMREIRPAFPVILSSGYADPRILEGHGVKPESVLAKPYHPDALLRRVRAALDSVIG